MLNRAAAAAITIRALRHNWTSARLIRTRPQGFSLGTQQVHLAPLRTRLLKNASVAMGFPRGRVLLRYLCLGAGVAGMARYAIRNYR